MAVYLLLCGVVPPGLVQNCSRHSCVVAVKLALIWRSMPVAALYSLCSWVSMSNFLLIILVLGSCVTFGGFLSKFSKCCFHRCNRSYWLVAFSLAFAVRYLLLTSFIVCHAILDCLSQTKSLILSIWFCMYSVCSFRYMLANSFCAFLSFRALVLVGFFILHLEAVFTSTHFSLTANRSLTI